MSAFKYTRLDKTQAAMLLVDHQAGLISLVQDFPPNEFKNNVLALAALAKFFKLPTILTTSFEEGPNGPIDPKELFLIKGATHIALYDKLSM
jgi:nicotinamidase-related amidase